MNTLGVTVTTLGSVLVRLIVTPPAGAGVARLTANGSDWPCVTVTISRQGHGSRLADRYIRSAAGIGGRTRRYSCRARHQSFHSYRAAGSSG